MKPCCKIEQLTNKKVIRKKMGQGIATSKSECFDFEKEDVMHWDKFDVQEFLKMKEYPDGTLSTF